MEREGNGEGGKWRGRKGNGEGGREGRSWMKIEGEEAMVGAEISHTQGD